jgi:saccharopine dehydrogenase-like NADP-dependent oxidoreductase
LRTLLLGSSGFFGSTVARLLAQRDCFGSLFLASRDPSKVEGLAKDLGEKVSSVALDMLDDVELRKMIATVDLVVNAAGATLDTAVPAMRAAAAAGVSYCDIAAESGVLLQAEHYQDEFLSSGATILVGAGFHPGVTDLLGQVASSNLDEVSALDYYVVGNFPDYGDANGMIGMLEGGWEGSEGLKGILAGIGLPCTYIKGSERTIVEPWTTTLRAETPDGFAIDFTYFSTLEPLALNRTHPEIPDIATYYGAWPNEINSVLKKTSREAMTGEKTSSEALKEVFTAAKAEYGLNPKVHFWVEAKGKKDGKEVRCQVFSSEPWATNAQMVATTTGVLAFAAEKLATGSIKRKGLVTAADVLSADEVFPHLSQGKDPGLVINLIQ